MDANAGRALAERLIRDIWNERRLDLLGEIFVAQPVVHRGGEASCGGEDLVGLDAFVDEHVKTSFAAFPEFRQELEDVIVDGDRIAIRFRGYGKHDNPYMSFAPTGLPFQYEGLAILRVEGGLIAELWTQTNLVKNLESQAG